MITKVTYNDHGDKMEEPTMTAGDLNPTKSAEGSEIAPTAAVSLSPQESEVRYGYQYDRFGNWIERTNKLAVVPERTLHNFDRLSPDDHVLLTVSESPGSIHMPD